MEKVLILDFGSQLSQLIARRVRELSIYCELHPFDISFEEIKRINPKGIILTGSPHSVNSGEYIADERIFNLGIPILGICYGMQWMVHSLGGKVEIAHKREYGSAKVYIQKSHLTDGIYDETNPYALKVWMSHGDKVVSLPDDFEVIGFNDNCPFAMIADEKRNFYGIQFHPEVTHTIKGTQLLAKFLFDICNCKPSWTMPNYIDTAINDIKEKVGDDNVVLGLSGGVDSTVAATLIHQAINKQLICIFVDHGLLRKNEANEVLSTYREHLGLNIIYIDAKDRFMERLAKVSDPEQKRKIIGKEFVEIFQEEAKKLNNIKWLAQGTIYPDVIESASDKHKKAHAIKSHHNVGGLPDTLHLKLLEPLRNLFKDEVRKLGLTLGLPKEMIFRHPFPGPGLAVRILGEVTPYYVKLLQDADAILIEELTKNTNDKGEKWYYLVSQAFVVFLPIKSVGVMGDGRSYDYVVSLRVVITEDFMTANWAKLPYDLLAKISSRIINEVKGINRVVYDISSKPPATVEWE